MTSHRPAGQPQHVRREALAASSPPAGRRGIERRGIERRQLGGPGPGRAHRYPSKIGTKVSFQPVTTLGSCQDG